MQSNRFLLSLIRKLFQEKQKHNGNFWVLVRLSEINTIPHPVVIRSFGM